MDIRTLTPDFSVAPQITPDDAVAIAGAGFRLVVCNRPDSEVGADLVRSRVRAAVEAAGMAWAENLIDGRAMTMENVEAQGRIADESDGPVLAYCRTGTRSATAWALSRAGVMSTDAILRAARDAGYSLDGMREQIEALAAIRR